MNRAYSVSEFLADPSTKFEAIEMAARLIWEASPNRSSGGNPQVAL